MKSSTVLLPALAAICHGAALPQSIGYPSGISIGGAAPTSGPSFTFVIPCAPGASECTPRTITLAGRDAEEMPRSLLAREPQSLGDVSRTNIILPPSPSTSSHHHHKTTSTSSYGWWKRQVLGQASRTNIILPPAPTTSDCDEPHWKRQTLGDPTRTNLDTPTATPSSTWGSLTTVTVTVTKTVWPSSSASTGCTDSSAVPTRSTSWGDGTTRPATTTLAVPTLALRDGQWATTTTVYVTATPSSSSTSKTKKWTTATISSSSACGWDRKDCGTTVKPWHTPTHTSDDLSVTLTLPPLTFGWPPKRDAEEAEKTSKSTTTYPKHRTTLTPGSGRGSTIVNSATIPRVTFTAPLERDAEPEPAPWKTSTSDEWGWPEPTTSTQPHHHHTTTPSDSVIRATVTLPIITLGRRDDTTVPVLTAFPTSTWTADLSGFPGWSWYWPFPKPTATGSPLTVPVDKRNPQVLGYPTRTEIVTPSSPGGWPWWHKPTPTSGPLTVPVDKRDPQILGWPTRTEIVTPSSPPGWPWWPFPKPTPTGGPLTVPVDKREPQTLGWPTRTEIVTPSSPPGWPWWPFPKPTPTGWPLTVPVDKREPQTLGYPTRTEIVTPSSPSTTRKPWWPHPTSTVIVTITETTTKGYTTETETCYSPTLIATTATLPVLTLPPRQISIVEPSPTNIITNVITIPNPLTPTPLPPVYSTTQTHPHSSTFKWWPTSIITITVTETYTTSKVIRTTVTLPPITLPGKRQEVIGTITRTMITTTATPTALTTLSTSVVKKALK